MHQGPERKRGLKPGKTRGQCPPIIVAVTGNNGRPSGMSVQSECGCASCREMVEKLRALEGVEVRETPDIPAPGSSGAPRLGKYAVVRELGRGAMGIVCEAVDTHLNRRVALKMLSVNPGADPEEAALDEERFLREARISAGLPRHPSIVQVYEAGVLAGRRYIASELIDGRPMDEWRRMGSITIRQQAQILRDAALAVHHAHENGVVHRDLKPNNILVGPNMRSFVSDFGLAKPVGGGAAISLTASGTILGTPVYMSPEQAQGLRTVDRRSDVWSLGVILYEILAGRAPFEGKDAIDTIIRIINDEVPAPSAVAGADRGHKINRALERICMRALVKDPDKRYPTARDFADDLTRWLRGAEVGAARISSYRVPRPPAMPVRGRNYWMLGAISALLLAVGMGIFTLCTVSAMGNGEEVKVKVEQPDADYGTGDRLIIIVEFGKERGVKLVPSPGMFLKSDGPTSDDPTTSSILGRPTPETGK